MVHDVAMVGGFRGGDGVRRIILVKKRRAPTEPPVRHNWESITGILRGRSPAATRGTTLSAMPATTTTPATTPATNHDESATTPTKRPQERQKKG
jgi:hypothetical protein